MLLNEDKTDVIIKCFYKVYNKLGYGFLEKVCENAMILELRKEGLHCLQQVSVPVYYDGVEIGLYFSDILVDNEVIIELKAVEGEIINNMNCNCRITLKQLNSKWGLYLTSEKFQHSEERYLQTNNKSVYIRPVRVIRVPIQ